MRRKPLSAGTRFAIWARDGFCCTYCGVNAIDGGVVLEVDHVIPVIEGGTNDFENLKTACRPCNRRKGPPARRAQAPMRVAFTVVVTPEMAERLDCLAEARGQKRAAFVRLLLKEGLERYERIERIAQVVDVAV